MAIMVSLETQIPEDIFKLLQARGLYKEALAERSRQLLAVRFYQDRFLSLGKAARMAGMEKWEFVEFLSDHNVPVIDFRENELEAEFDSVDQLAKELNE